MTISVNLTDQPVGVTVSANAGTVSVSAATVTAVQVGIGNTTVPATHGGTHAAGGSDPITVSASQIGSGTIATDRLGSGTASSSTYLRGDQTWAAVSGGGGSLEYANLASFPATGASAVIYVARDTNKLYRWSGSAYVELSASEATAWANITGKPSTFSPSSHTHQGANVTIDVGATNLFNDDDTVTSAFRTVDSTIASITSALSGKANTAHTHGNITNAGAIGSTSGQIVVTTTSGVLTTAATISSGQVSGLGGAATLNVGTSAGTVAAGNDSRLSDSRTPASHTHGNLSNLGQLASGTMSAGSVGGPAVFDVLTGSIARGAFGTAAGEVCQGNDSRLTNTRTPTDGTVTTAKIVDANVTVAKLSATGTASSSTFLRGDGAWASAGSTSASDLTSGTLAEARLPNLVILHPFLLAGM